MIPEQNISSERVVQSEPLHETQAIVGVCNANDSTNTLVPNIEEVLQRFCVLPRHAYLPLTMWIVATYCPLVFDCFPYLALLSPVKRCGKTRVLELLDQLTSNPWRGTAPSPAALYRMMGENPTLLLDEVELLNAKNKSESSQLILAILNAGHRKGATIPRCDGPQHQLKFFPIYGAKAYAVIGRLPDTLSDRSITVNMHRRTPDQKIARFSISRIGPEVERLKQEMAKFCQHNIGPIQQVYKRLIEDDLVFLSDREADLWIPLFAMCEVLVPDRVGELKECAEAMSLQKAADALDDSLSIKLLADIASVWPIDRERCNTALLLRKLIGLEESPWGEFGLTARKLARMLRPFGVEPRVMRTEDQRGRGYERRELVAVIHRYVGNSIVTSVTEQ